MTTIRSVVMGSIKVNTMSEYDVDVIYKKITTTILKIQQYEKEIN